MSFNYFYVKRAEVVLSELAKLRYREIVPIDEFEAREDNGEKVNTSPADLSGNGKTFRRGEFWSGRDKYLWLSKKISLPENWSGRDVVGVFDFGKTGEGNNSSFESLLFVNGKPYQGVDSNHQEVFFDMEKLGSDIQLDFRLWSGLEGGGEKQTQYHQYKEAFTAWLDAPTDAYYFLTKNIIGTINELPESESVRHDLENALMDSFKIVDFTNSRSEKFYDSVKNALDALEASLAKIPDARDVRVACVGHTHIDLAWLWRIKHTREKGGRSFATVQRMMDRYPEYIFVQTQPQLYEWVKNDFPEIYAEIKKRVAEGKWEASGASWVEMDCNLPSGEALVRQILYGKRFFKNEFGVDSDFLWLPDVFGYTWSLPQILKLSGVNTFITTKISWNEINRMPQDTFMWRGIDGTEILTHFITTPDDKIPPPFYTYNGKILPMTVRGVWTNYMNKKQNKDLLISYGFGDGGGGPTREMIENRRAIAKIPGMPTTVTSKVSDWLKTVHANYEKIKDDFDCPVWDKELYLEFHRGTYTSQAYNKKMNRRMELLYRDAEFLQTLAALKNKSWKNYDKEKLDEGWKIILHNQFHDIIPGSSINEVYQFSREEYATAEKLANGMIAKSREGVFKKTDDSFVVTNTSGWNRSSYVALPEFDTASYHLESTDGKQIPCQKVDGKVCAYVADIKPTASVNVLKKSGAAKNSSSFSHGKNFAESPRHKIEWNDAGQLVSIFDKKLARETLTSAGNVFQMFEDKPRNFDAWELESSIDLKKESVTDFKGANVVSEGECCLRVQFEWAYNKSKILQQLVLYKDSARIDFETKVDWQETQKLMKVAFPVDVRSVSARYDIQFGSVERATHQSTSWDFAQIEVVGHHWADLHERGFGVAIMSDSKYGYDIKKNVMRLSLLKSPIFPDTEADKGLQEFTYSVFTHAEEWYDAGVIQSAWDLNSQLMVATGSVDENFSQLLDLDNCNVTLDSVKKSEDGEKIVVRLHENSGGKTKLDMKLLCGAKNWYVADLMENKTGDVHESASVQYMLRPFEIVTIVFEV